MNKGELILDGIPHDVTTKLLDYLGDSLSSEEREAFEARLLEDELFSQQIEEAEFLLLEAYADGSLPEPLHKRIAGWIASSPHARRQVEITRSLCRIAAPESTRRARHLALWALAAAACIAAVAVLPLLHRRDPASSALLTARNTPETAVPASPPQDTILLVAERLRGAAPGRPSVLPYPVHPGRPVRLQIVIPSAHIGDTYAVTVRPEGDNPTAQFDAIRAQKGSQAPFIEMTLAPGMLRPGSYVADLSAPGERFRVAFGVAAPK